VALKYHSASVTDFFRLFGRTSIQIATQEILHGCGKTRKWPLGHILVTIGKFCTVYVSSIRRGIRYTLTHPDTRRDMEPLLNMDEAAALLKLTRQQLYEITRR